MQKEGFDNNSGFQRIFDMNSPNLQVMLFGFGLLQGFGVPTRILAPQSFDAKEIAMKNPICVATVMAAVLATAFAFAGPRGGCHYHANEPVKETVIEVCANDQKDVLLKSEKIDASWKSVKLDKAETIEVKNMKEWKVTFKNPAAMDATRQTLYMFYTLTGKFIGANFTGQQYLE